MNGIRFSDRVYGILESGNVTEKYLLDLIPQIQANFIEIYSHPSFDNASEFYGETSSVPSKELTALLSDQVRDTLPKYGFELTNYLQC
jgi:hypothetical protein